VHPRIASYLDKIQEKAIALQKLQEEMEKEIERLKESILHKAFGGEL
jgi:restriction endonuclease S subunit